MSVDLSGPEYSWLDSGTCESLAETGSFVKTIEKRQFLKIACVEEIAYRMGFITLAQLTERASALAKSQYGQYLLKLVTEIDSGRLGAMY